MNLMELKQKIEAKEAKVAVIGLGYVGLPVAIGFAGKYEVVGFVQSSPTVSVSI